MATQTLAIPAYQVVERPSSTTARGKSAAYNDDLLKVCRETFNTNKAVEFDALLWNDCVRFKINKALGAGFVVKSKKANNSVVMLWVEAK